MEKQLDHETLKKFLDDDELYEALMKIFDGKLTLQKLATESTLVWDACASVLTKDAREKAREVVKWAKDQLKEETQIVGDLLKELESFAPSLAKVIVERFSTLEKLADAKDLVLIKLIEKVRESLPPAAKDYDTVISLGIRAWAAAKLGRIQMGGVTIIGGHTQVGGSIVGGNKYG